MASVGGERELSYAQALESAVVLVRSKWATAVLYSLARGPLRMGDLLDEVNEHHTRPGEQPLSYKVLSATLKPLIEADLVLNHKEADTFAAKSWYGLTSHGRALIRASSPLVKWYQDYRAAVEAKQSQPPSPTVD